MKKIFSKPVIISVLIIGLLMIINSQGWLQTPKDYFFRLISPAQRRIYRLSSKANDVLDFFASIKNQNYENQQLKQENQHLLARLVEFNNLVRENDFLREQLQLSGDQKHELVLAEVIGQNLSKTDRCILIDKGGKDGIKDKATVITAGNILVGKVIEVMPSFSKVRLITDVSSRVNAFVQESDATGLVKGISPGLEIDLISQGKEIKDRDLIVTSGLAGIFPSGLLVGNIKKIVSTDVQVFQRAEIEQVVDFEIIEKVFVIKD